MADIHKEAWRQSMIAKFPELTPEEAIIEGRKMYAKGGLATAGKPKPWATFANKDKARESGKLGAQARWSKANLKEE